MIPDRPELTLPAPLSRVRAVPSVVTLAIVGLNGFLVVHVLGG